MKIKIILIVCMILSVILIGMMSWEIFKDGRQSGKIAGEKPLGEPVAKLRSQPIKIISRAEVEEDSMVVTNPPTQDDYPMLDGEINQEQERFQLTTYYEMPKSVDLLIKDAFRMEEDKEEAYRLIWKWQGYEYIEDTEVIVLPNLYYDDLVDINAVTRFIEWLYENDYEIVKKEDK